MRTRRECTTTLRLIGLRRSRPSRRRPWEYLFFIDLLGHQQDAAIAAALKELSKHTSTCEVLGSFPRAEQALNE